VLRITINEEAAKVMLKVEGRIVGPWTAELDRIWQSLGPSLDGRKLAVDLRGVSYIDHKGREILAEMCRNTGAQFQTDTPLTEYFAQEARSSTLQNASGNGNGNGHRKSNQKGAPK
jgi:hypothetical protein